MVRAWFRRALAPREVCGPLCRAVQAEVESIGRAAGISDEVGKRRGGRRQS